MPTQTARVFRADGPHARFEAWFSGRAYAPHRHDSYTLCITLGGVQSFAYRGAMRHARPGEVVILHPDELHDGEAGTDDAFGYRALNLDPALLQSALGGQALPFIDGGTSRDPALKTALTRLLSDFDHALEPAIFDDGLCDIAAALSRLAGHQPRPSARNLKACRMARDILRDTDTPFDLNVLAQTCGLDRWQLSRDFKSVYGTSPYRFSLLRRLDAARDQLMTRQPIAQTAYACGFADQAHLTRQFKSAYGMTPRAWQKLSRTKLQ